MTAMAIAVPHLNRTADELVAPGALHAVDAQIGAADAHGVFRSPGARWVVFGCHQPVPRVQRGGHGRAEVNVPKAQHEIAGREDDVLYRLLVRKTVDAPNEFEVPRAPGRVVAYRLHVARRGLLGRRVVPGQGQLDDPAWERQRVAVLQGAEALFNERKDRSPGCF